jgi:hypothetical protein
VLQSPSFDTWQLTATSWPSHLLALTPAGTLLHSTLQTVAKHNMINTAILQHLYVDGCALLNPGPQGDLSQQA